MNQSVTRLEKIKCVLERLLPSSVQLYNILVCQLSGDGVEREIVVNDDIAGDNVAILVLNKLESPKNIFTMFCTENCKGILKGFLADHVNWALNNEFTVSFVQKRKKIRERFFMGWTLITQSLSENCLHQDLTMIGLWRYFCLSLKIQMIKHSHFSQITFTISGQNVVSLMAERSCRSLNLTTSAWKNWERSGFHFSCQHGSSLMNWLNRWWRNSSDWGGCLEF